MALSIAFLLGTYGGQIRLDASSESLILESDLSLEYYRAVKEKYGSDNYLIITYQPKADLFKSATLGDLLNLRDTIKMIKGVDSVITILDVPLLNSPSVGIRGIQKEIPTLISERTDKDLARIELTKSVLYKDLLINEKGTITSLIVNLEEDAHLNKLQSLVTPLRKARRANLLSESEVDNLAVIEDELASYLQGVNDRRKKIIQNIRHVIDPHRDLAKIHLGGVPMIVTDSIDYVSNDLSLFGLLVICFIIALLVLIFRHLCWVFLSLLCCFIVGAMMFGVLGMTDWPITVVSSNFISLLLIITLSLTIHLIVSYSELCTKYPKDSHRALVVKMVSNKWAPCFFTAITTMVAFSSLVVSDISPVISFGWIMTIGTLLALIVTFVIFPALLLQFSKVKVVGDNYITGKVTHFFAQIIRERTAVVVGVYAVIIIASVIGLSRLSVENSFINYYKKSTEIYRGMTTIDRELGGTTPLDIIIDAPTLADGSNKHDGLTSLSEGYWFNSWMLEDIEKIHKFLDDLPSTGKVLSLYTTMEMLRNIDRNIEMDSVYMNILYAELPQPIKQILFKPYISVDGNQLRFSVRIYESDDSLRRSELLNTITDGLVNKLNLEREQVHITGMLVLYNNVLQSLVKSQIKTVGFVLMVVLFMFLILFKNISLAFIAIVPNVFVAILVLGTMGWFGIPLDIMTITIAAICIGIAVDNTIHYVHRFMFELQKDNDYWGAICRAHASIGQAMYYTAITIAFGFSVLVFSNFVPTVYFGLLTCFSMLAALLADFTLLPLLIVMLKPISLDRVNA